MNRNLVIVTIGGFIVAILVTILLQAGMSGKNDKKKKVKPDTVEVLVANRSRQVGQPLRNSDLRWQRWPESAAFEKAIVRKGDESAGSRLSGRVMRNITEGEPMLESDVSASSGDNILAARMETGKRAVAIEVDAASAAGGFVFPGDYIDVLMTYSIRTRRNNSAVLSALINQYATETVLEDVQVLAIDQDAIHSSKSATVSRTVTLAVTPQQAETLALSSEMGNLHLALRAVGDQQRKERSKADNVAGLFMDDTVQRLQREFQGMTTDVQIADVMRSINAIKNGRRARGQVMRIYTGDQIKEVSTR